MVKNNSEDVIDIIIKKLKKKGAKKIEIFGSYAIGEEREDSDIDLIVEFKNNRTLLELIEIEQELSEALNRKIDMLTPSSISPLIMEKISKEKKVIYSE